MMNIQFEKYDLGIFKFSKLKQVIFNKLTFFLILFFSIPASYAQYPILFQIVDDDYYPIEKAKVIQIPSIMTQITPQTDIQKHAMKEYVTNIGGRFFPYKIDIDDFFVIIKEGFVPKIIKASELNERNIIKLVAVDVYRDIYLDDGYISYSKEMIEFSGSIEFLGSFTSNNAKRDYQDIVNDCNIFIIESPYYQKINNDKTFKIEIPDIELYDIMAEENYVYLAAWKQDHFIKIYKLFWSPPKKIIKNIHFEVTKFNFIGTTKVNSNYFNYKIIRNRLNLIASIVPLGIYYLSYSDNKSNILSMQIELSFSSKIINDERLNSHRLKPELTFFSNLQVVENDLLPEFYIGISDKVPVIKDLLLAKSFIGIGYGHSFGKHIIKQSSQATLIFEIHQKFFDLDYAKINVFSQMINKLSLLNSAELGIETGIGIIGIKIELN